MALSWCFVHSNEWFELNNRHCLPRKMLVGWRPEKGWLDFIWTWLRGMLFSWYWPPCASQNTNWRKYSLLGNKVSNQECCSSPFSPVLLSCPFISWVIFLLFREDCLSHAVDLHAALGRSLHRAWGGLSWGESRHGQTAFTGGKMWADAGGFEKREDNMASWKKKKDLCLPKKRWESVHHWVKLVSGFKSQVFCKRGFLPSACTVEWSHSTVHAL